MLRNPSNPTQDRLVDRFNSPSSTFPEVRIEAEILKLPAVLNENFLSKKKLTIQPRLDSTVESQLSLDAIRDKPWEPDVDII